VVPLPTDDQQEPPVNFSQAEALVVAIYNVTIKVRRR